jgi:hypothetical protein
MRRQLAKPPAEIMKDIQAALEQLAVITGDLGSREAVK